MIFCHLPEPPPAPDSWPEIACKKLLWAGESNSAPGLGALVSVTASVSYFWPGLAKRTVNCYGNALYSLLEYGFALFLVLFSILGCGGPASHY